MGWIRWGWWRYWGNCGFDNRDCIFNRKLFYWNEGVRYFYYTCEVFDDLRGLLGLGVSLVFNCLML